MNCVECGSRMKGQERLFCSQECRNVSRRKRRIETKNYLMLIDQELDKWLGKGDFDSFIKFVTQQKLNQSHITKQKIISINIFSGMTPEQITVVKEYVKKGLSPMGFTVYTDKNQIWYMGRRLL